MTPCDVHPDTTSLTFTAEYGGSAFDYLRDGDIVTFSDKPGERFILRGADYRYRIEKYYPPEAGFKIKRPNRHTPPPVVIQACRYTPRLNQRLRPPIRAPDRG